MILDRLYVNSLKTGAAALLRCGSSFIKTAAVYI